MVYTIRLSRFICLIFVGAAVGAALLSPREGPAAEAFEHTGAHPTLAGTYGRATGTRVDVSALPKDGSTGAPAAAGAAPRRKAPAATPSESKTLSGSRLTAAAPQVADVGALPIAQPAAAPTPAAAGFAGLGSTDNSSKLLPGDAQIAAGTARLVEMTNVQMRILNKATGASLSTVPLSSFFSVTGGWSQGSPRLLYDAPSGRFFASYTSWIDNASGTDQSRLHVTVSNSGDPLGAWTQYAFTFSDDLLDQPSIGITDDKVTLSYNRYNINSGALAGAQVVVLQKSDMIAAAGTVQSYTSSIDASSFGIRPAQSLSATTTQYMVSLGTALPPTTLPIWTVTGTPAGANVVISNVASPTVASYDVPFSAEQGGITGDQIDAGDNRPLDAVWRNGKLWTSMTTQCDWNAQGDPFVRACLKFVEIDTANSNAVLQDFTFGAPFSEYYFPAIQIDSIGDLVVVFSSSAPSTPGPGVFIEARVAGQQAGDTANTMSGSTLLKAGEREVTFTQCLGSPTPGCVDAPYPWGEYLGAAVDPSDPTTVWVAGEYAKDDGFALWGTWIGSFDYVNASTDTDGDGYTDLDEIALGENPHSYCAIMRADVNGNHSVSIGDLALVAGEFGQNVPPAPARYDQNSSGTISIGDLALMAAHFGQNVSQCP